jgi:hypothetical protein
LIDAFEFGDYNYFSKYYNSKLEILDMINPYKKMLKSFNKNINHIKNLTVLLENDYKLPNMLAILFCLKFIYKYEFSYNEVKDRFNYNVFKNNTIYNPSDKEDTTNNEADEEVSDEAVEEVNEEVNDEENNEDNNEENNEEDNEENNESDDEPDDEKPSYRNMKNIFLNKDNSPKDFYGRFYISNSTTNDWREENVKKPYFHMAFPSDYLFKYCIFYECEEKITDFFKLSKSLEPPLEIEGLSIHNPYNFTFSPFNNITKNLYENKNEAKILDHLKNNVKEKITNKTTEYEKFYIKLLNNKQIKEYYNKEIKYNYKSFSKDIKTLKLTATKKDYSNFVNEMNFICDYIDFD